ncbi:MAG TPA: hypothetical protein PKI93_04025 [Alphaproteobacteria bacterium]|nr:hypothetical protein [Alphaproteobacteria bacterium]HNS44376.1 hypothetical protein [Alphaproteobacteria bacterium]
MGNFLKTLAIGATFSASVGSAQAGSPPRDICILDAEKSVATIYSRTEGNEFAFELKSARLVRGRDVSETADYYWDKAWGRPAKLEPLTIQFGRNGSYSADTLMAAPYQNRTEIVPKYGSAILVNITDWKSGGYAVGTCEEIGMKDGETRISAPIVQPLGQYGAFKLYGPGQSR